MREVTREAWREAMLVLSELRQAHSDEPLLYKLDRREIDDLVRAFAFRREASEQRVPDGWKLVPETATEAMVSACGPAPSSLPLWHAMVREVWGLMLAASPSPTSSEGAKR